SELALERAQSPQVKEFARKMIRDHTNSSQQLSQAQVASATGGSVPPATLLPEHRRMLDELEQARGAEFDRLYMHQQLQVHQEALALHRNYAQAGQNAQVRSTAGQIVPVIESHSTALHQ